MGDDVAQLFDDVTDGIAPHVDPGRADDMAGGEGAGGDVVRRTRRTDAVLALRPHARERAVMHLDRTGDDALDQNFDPP